MRRAAASAGWRVRVRVERGRELRRAGRVCRVPAAALPVCARRARDRESPLL